MFCKQCGEQLEEGSILCEGCGELVRRSRSSVAEAAAGSHKKSKIGLIVIIALLVLGIGTAVIFAWSFIAESDIVRQAVNIISSDNNGAAADAISPSETVTAFLTHIQTGQYGEAHGLIIGESPIFFYDIEEEYSGIFKNLSYSNMTENKNGDQASVTLTINAVDFASVMEDIMIETFNLIFTEITEEALMEQIDNMLMDKMTAHDAPKVSNEIIVALEVFENQWKIIMSEAFADAITGGMLSFVEYAEQWLID